MKKLKLFLVVLGVLLITAACSSGDDQAGDAPQPPAPPAQYGPPNRGGGKAPQSMPEVDQGAAQTSLSGNSSASYLDVSPFADSVLVSYTSSYMNVQSDGIPDHPVGDFPWMGDSNNDGRADNPNSIQAQDYDFNIPAVPQWSDTTTDLPMGPVGIAVSGAVIYNAWTAEHTYAVETEVFDECQGHPDQRGAYHYHQESDCISGDLIGYAFDGYEIRPSVEADGSTPTGLDECNGHFHDGAYHYHATDDPSKPLLGCYHGVVEYSNITAPR